MIDIVVPQVGEATAEVVLARWLKGEGEPVTKGEPLFEVDTDKYVVEIEAFASGTLAEILVPAGSGVMPQQVVARLLPEGAAAESPNEAAPKPARVDMEARPTPSLDGARARPAAARGARVLASPKARRLAEELGLDVAGLADRGTGPGGLVTAEDVQAAVLEGAPAGAAAAPEPLTVLRRTIAARMQASKQQVPHFYLLVDVDMGEAQRLRVHCTEALGWERPPSVTDLVVAACARALEALPRANVSYTADGLVPHGQTNIGIAMGVDDGLVVPVLAGAGRLALRDLSEQARSLAERARSGRLRQADLAERSLVVSNLGMHGVDAFIAIIDMPDPMILAVGQVGDRCVPVDGTPAVRPMCTLTLSVDHRAFDGVLGARFLGAVKEQLESPFEMLEN